MRLSSAGIKRFLLGRPSPPTTAEPVPPTPGFREGDTFVPERILALDESLAVLHATSQALACCALASRPTDRPDADTASVPSLAEEWR